MTALRYVLGVPIYTAVCAACAAAWPVHALTMWLAGEPRAGFWNWTLMLLPDRWEKP
jgi:hypothetical protein